MKTVIFFIVWLWILVFYYSCNDNFSEVKESRDIISNIENRKVFFDTININIPYNYSFIISNELKDTFFIDRISYSCECVSLLKKIDYVLPNKKDSLTVSLIPTRRGYMSRAVYLYVKDQVEPIDLILEGYVK
jgi:hypothetical protein